MNIIEVMQLLILSVICIYSSIYDLKHGLIPNKVVIPALVICTALSSIYYIVYAKEFIIIYFTNLIILIFISLLLFFLRVWGGGDSKLLILLAIGIPARYYFYFTHEAVPTVYIIIWSFSFGFLYLLFESTLLAIKKERPVSASLKYLLSKKFFLNMLASALYITLINQILFCAAGNFVENNYMLIMLAETFLIMIIAQNKIYRNVFVMLAAGIIDILFFVLKGLSFTVNDLLVYVLVIAIFVLRGLIERYNYKEVPITALRPGMIISAVSVIQFLHYKITGLPVGVTEDLRSKLTAEEIAAINEWGRISRNSSVTIVNKVPFAIFISLAFFSFIILGVIG